MSRESGKKVEVDGTVVECVQGDITRQEGFDAIVNAANAELRTGGGVAGAIHAAAGPGLEEECRPLAPINPGEAVITSGHDLPNPWVIHCLGPVHGRDEPSNELLASCYRQALGLADRKGLSSVAFPALSTGAFGFPLEPAARIAMETVLATLPAVESVKRVRFVLFDQEALEIHARTLETLTG